MTDEPFTAVPYLSALREELVRGIERHNRRRRHRLVAAKALAGVLAAAAVGATAVLGLGGASHNASAAVLDRVAASLRPRAGTVLHIRAIVTVEGMAPSRYELWSHGAGRPADYRVIKFGHEFARQAHVTSMFVRSTNQIIVRANNSTPPKTSVDIAIALSQLVAADRAHLIRTTEIRGVAAYEISIRGRVPGWNSGIADGIYYVKKSNYDPLFVQTYVACATGQCRETVRVLTYQYLPATPRNLRQLNLPDQHPTAQVISQDNLPPAGAARRRPAEAA
jgi:hypothetical protein